MPPANTSFIPKQSGNKVEKRNTPRRVFIGTIFVRVVFFAVLIVAVSVFFFDRRLQSQVQAETAALSSSAEQFDAAQMESILAFDRQLQQVTEIFYQSFSMQSFLTTLAGITANLAQVTDLEATRLASGDYEVKLSMKADSYDTLIAQRNTYADNSRLASSTIDGLQRTLATESNAEESSGQTNLPLSFQTQFLVPAASFPLTGTVSSAPSQPVVPQPETSPVEPTTSPADDGSNETST